jgi:filamentous hemagglutinin family protein
MTKTHFWLYSVTLSGLIFSAKNSLAQTYQPSDRPPVADSTLGTQVSGNGNNFDITGGTSRGQTLFHSFQDFSVPTNGAANFANPAGIRDTISRVTGGSFSDINGRINSNGANFFLINPNGIVFGPNAQLNVGRAFMASTANGINLVDAGGRAITFGTNPNGDAPLLTINPNVFFNVSSLTMGGRNGQINNFGTLKTTNPNQYIGLIGGNVSMNGGEIIAPGGKVELGGLNQAGAIGFSLDNGVQLPTNVERGNVSLVTAGTSPSIINIESVGGGSVGVFAKDITLQGKGTYIRAGIATGLGSPTATAGDINLDASGDISFDGLSGAFSTVNTGAVGKGGNIKINTRNLSVTNGSELASSTVGQGDAGNVKITASDNIFFDGTKDNFNSGAFSTVDQGAVGKGGNIEINTRNLSVTNGARLTASTEGQGNAGTIKITATGDISFDGIKDGYKSKILSNLDQGGVGKGGNIEINTRNLSVTNGTQIQASTSGQGDAGNIKLTATGDIFFDDGAAFSTVEQGGVGKGGNIEIDTHNFSVTNGAQIQASTSGQGDAGNIKLTATGDISFDGIDDRKDGSNSAALSTVEQRGVGKGGNIEIDTRNLSLSNGSVLASGTKGQGDAGNIKITATNDISFDGSKDGFNSGAFSIVAKEGMGKGGNIEINTGNLSLTNQARITSSNFGQGDTGNIIVNANTITLKKGGIFSDATNSTGGDLNIITKDYLLLRNGSLISTDSDSSGKNGNGGNITIGSPLIIALPGNNDITANAYAGNGGKVTIKSDGLFNIKYRPKGQESDFTNDITASSTFGQSGNVNISTPGTDPGKDSTQLPTVPTDASNQIAQTCSASNRQNKLTVAGRGGLPPNANDPLNTDVVWQDTRATNSQPAVSSTTTNPVKLPPPAVGWVFDGKGKVTLIAAATEGQPTGTSVTCPQEREQFRIRD